MIMQRSGNHGWCCFRHKLHLQHANARDLPPQRPCGGARRNHDTRLKARPASSSRRRRAAERGGYDHGKKLPTWATFARRCPSHRNAGHKPAAHPRQPRTAKVSRSRPTSSDSDPLNICASTPDKCACKEQVRALKTPHLWHDEEGPELGCKHNPPGHAPSSTKRSHTSKRLVHHDLERLRCHDLSGFPGEEPELFLVLSATFMTKPHGLERRSHRHASLPKFLRCTTPSSKGLW